MESNKPQNTNVSNRDLKQMKLLGTLERREESCENKSPISVMFHKYGIQSCQYMAKWCKFTKLSTQNQKLWWPKEGSFDSQVLNHLARLVLEYGEIRERLILMLWRQEGKCAPDESKLETNTALSPPPGIGGLFTPQFRDSTLAQLLEIMKQLPKGKEEKVPNVPTPSTSGDEQTSQSSSSCHQCHHLGLHEGGVQKKRKLEPKPAPKPSYQASWNKKKVCYNCNKIGHLARDCWYLNK